MLSFEETKKTYTHRWRNASADPFLDTYDHVDYAINEFTDTLRNAAAKATLKSVSVELIDKPQIATAEIIDVKVPDTIQAGTDVTLAIVLLPHWSFTENNKRVFEKEVTLSIPSSFRSADVNLKVVAESFAVDFDDLFNPILGYDLDEFIEKHQDMVPEPGTMKITLSNDDNSDEIEEELVLDDYIVTGEFFESFSVE